MSQTKENLINDLGFIHEAQFKLQTKIAITSFYNIKYPKMVEIMLAFIEYFQLFAQIVFLVLETTLLEINMDGKPLLRFLVIFCQIFNPFSSLSSQNSLEASFITVIFSILICYLIAKNLVFFYIVYTARHNIKQNMLLINIWRWIFKTQVRVLYFIVSSFWAAIIREVSKNGLDVHGIKSLNTLIFCTLMIIIEYVNSIYCLISFIYVLPTKNFLSEKDNYTQIITLTQKLILQVLQIILPSSNSTVNAWVLSSICIAADHLRSFRHFSILPLYNIKALFYQGDLLIIISSLSLSWFFQIILNSTKDYKSEEFIWVTWVFLTCLGIISSNIYLKTIIFKIVTSSKKMISPHLLIHKMILIKQIRKMALAYNTHQGKYQYWYLLKETVDNNFKALFNIGSEIFEETLRNLELKESCNMIFLNYLESSAFRQPKNDLLKLHIAFYAKKLKQYGKAIKIALDLKKANQYLIELNTSLLILDIQNMIRSNYEDPSAKINLFLYTRSQSHFAELKNKTLKQAELQIQLCQEIISDSPRLGKISEWSLEIHKYQKDVEKRAKRMFEVIPDYFIEPIAFLAYYYMTVNHSIVDSLKYRKMYDNKSEKYKKYFKSEELQEENLYQSQNNFMIISAHKADAGNILFCSKNIEQIYGGDVRMHIGKNINNISVPCLQGPSFQQIIENANQNKMDTIIRWYGWHNEGYMVEVDYYFNVFPFLSRGFCFGALTRLADTDKDCIVINQNGIIEGTTKNVRDKLGLQLPRKTPVNIKLLSEDLMKINKAFNMVALHQSKDILRKNQEDNKSFSPKISEDNQRQASDLETIRPDEELDLEKAQALCSIFSIDGREITIKSIFDDKRYLFHCKIIQLGLGNEVKRMIHLRSIEVNNEEQDVDNLISREVKDEKAKSIDDEDPGTLPQADDIDFELNTPISPPRVSRFKFGSYNNNEENSNLASPKKTVFQFTTEKIQTEASNLLSPVRLSKNRSSLIRHSQREVSQIEQCLQHVHQRNEKRAEEHLDLKEQKVEGSVADSRMSKGFKQIKISKAFKEAISVRSTRKYFKTLCVLFYFIFIWIFSIQLDITLSWKNDLLALKVKKDILNNALLRNYYATDLPLFVTLVIGMDSKKIDTNFMLLSADDHLSFLKNETLTLRDANNILLADTNSLSEEMRKSMFYKDVKVFDYCQNCTEQAYVKVDNFQATNTAIEVILRLTPLIKDHSSSYKEELELFIRNSLNDLMLKNAEISVIFEQSLDIQRQDILGYAKTYLILTLVMLTVNALIMVVSIWNHYSAEIQNLSAFIKINLFGVNEVLAKLKYFKNMLENQNSFEDWLIEDFENKKPLHLTNVFENKVKKDLMKTPDCKSIVKKYRFYFAGLALMILISGGTCYWSQRTVQTFIEDIYDKQSQLFFLNLMRSRLNLVGHSLTQIVVSGPDAQIENLPILTFFENSIYEVYNLRMNLPKILAVESLDKNSDFYKTLFDDGCALVYYEPFCTHAKKNGISRSFVQILTVFENLIVDFYQKYSKLNQTEQSLYRMSYEDYNIFYTVYCIITGAELFTLISIADRVYESTLAVSSTQRSLFFGIFTFILSSMMILFWVFVLKEFKEINNRFKKTLKTLPPELILSNFFLKTFLAENSKGNLDFVRNGL